MLILYRTNRSYNISRAIVRRPFLIFLSGALIQEGLMPFCVEFLMEETMQVREKMSYYHINRIIRL